MTTVTPSPQSAPTQDERELAALVVLASAGATVPNDTRLPLVQALEAHGAWGALTWLIDAVDQRGVLAPAYRRAKQLVSAPRWGAATLASVAAWNEQGIRFVGRTDEEWPAALADLGDRAPIALWMRGKIPTMPDGAVSVVGSRKLSVVGHSRIDRIVARLPVPVISGLALGADETAHRAALLHGVPTVAVLPSGLDQPYPHTNRHLAERIVASGGALISETPVGISVARYRFLDRNRIIAALGSGSIIVEAAAVSGTLNEARHAHRLGRPIAAVPGTPGADQLIADGIAFPLLGAADLDALYEPDVAAS